MNDKLLILGEVEEDTVAMGLGEQNRAALRSFNIWNET